MTSRQMHDWKICVARSDGPREQPSGCCIAPKVRGHRLAPPLVPHLLQETVRKETSTLREEEEARDAAVMERVQQLAHELKDKHLRCILDELDDLKRSCLSYKVKTAAERVSSKTCAFVLSALAGVSMMSLSALISHSHDPPRSSGYSSSLSPMESASDTPASEPVWRSL